MVKTHNFKIILNTTVQKARKCPSFSDPVALYVGDFVTQSSFPAGGRPLTGVNLKKLAVHIANDGTNIKLAKSIH